MVKIVKQGWDTYLILNDLPYIEKSALPDRIEHHGQVHKWLAISGSVWYALGYIERP